MRILLIATHLNFGGITSYIISLARGLSKKGHKVFIASSGGDFVKKLKIDNITHITIPISTKSELSPKVLFSSVRLLSFIKREPIDVIHAQTRVTQILAYLVSKILRIPYITTCHGFFKKRIGRRLFGAWGRKTIAISEAVREHLVNDFKVKKSDIELIYNGIDLKNFKHYGESEKEAIKRELNLKQGPIVGVIARISPVKGHKYLIEAMRKVIEKVSDVRLLIIGDGPAKDGLVSLVERLKIKENIYFFGSASDTAKFLSIMDVFVLPSLQEGLGLSAIEALAMKKAVVASDVGGVYTIIKNNTTGLLIPPRDSEVLAKAITDLLGDEQLRVRLGREGRKRVEDKFSLDAMIEKIEKLYIDVNGEKEKSNEKQ